jgi:hypothetical protein
MRALALVFAFIAAGGSMRDAGAQEIGRLFMTPEQRESLDARRKARVPDKPAAAPVVASPTTRVDGYVKRSGGPSTVWLNNEPLPEHAADAPRIRGGRTGEAHVDVPLGEGGARVPMKPGQVVNRETGEVRDLLGDGHIRARPQGAKK